VAQTHHILVKEIALENNMGNRRTVVGLCTLNQVDP
jgi:hypothetical protein